MICNVIRCDFCGNTEEYQFNKRRQGENADPFAADDTRWYSVKPMKFDDTWDVGGNSEHLCADCYRHLKEGVKRPMTISANPTPKGGEADPRLSRRGHGEPR